MRAISGADIAESSALPTPEPAWPREGAHQLVTFDLGEIHGLVLVRHRKVHRLLRLLHQRAHVRAGDVRDDARLEKGIAGHEGLHADRPEPALGIEMHIAFLLQRGQEPVRGGGGEPDLLADFGQDHALISGRKPVENGECPHQGLDLRAALRSRWRGRFGGFCPFCRC
jgi:hypothetical protein